tara:strand:+ start:385 stop:552 length:168 start_codon:yes stop_codon:yes gene_type:complete
MTITRKQLRSIERHSAYQIKSMKAMFDLLEEGRKEAELKRQHEKREDTNANEKLG